MHKSFKKTFQFVQMYPRKTLNEFKILESKNDFLNELQWNDKLAVAISYERVQTDRLLSASLYCLDDFNSIYGYSLKFLMRKNFLLMNELNQFIQQSSDAGLITKWLKGNQLEYSVQKPPKFQFVQSHMDAVLILFTFCLCLFSIAALILLIEFIVDKKVRTEKSARFWRYIEMSIDSRRYLWLNDLAY